MSVSCDDLRLVQTKVNMLPYKADAVRFGTPEFWAAITAEGGDCEDFAIEKYHRLLLAGMLHSALRFATCFVEPSAAPEKRDRYHCVLLVDHGGQTWVLDNRYPLPMEHGLLPYEWHKIQIAGTQRWEWAENADRSIE